MRGESESELGGPVGAENTKGRARGLQILDFLVISLENCSGGSRSRAPAVALTHGLIPAHAYAPLACPAVVLPCTPVPVERFCRMPEPWPVA